MKLILSCKTHNTLLCLSTRKFSRDDRCDPTYFGDMKAHANFLKSKCTFHLLKSSFGCNKALFFSSVAHPGIHPGHPRYLRCPQSAWHAWHPGRVGWYCGRSFGEERGVRAILLTTNLTYTYNITHTHITVL